MSTGGEASAPPGEASPRAGRAPLAVTTSGQPDASLLAQARAAAHSFGVPFLPRGRTSLEILLQTKAEALIVFAREAVEFVDPHGRFRWSPGMAHLRLQRFEQQDALNPDRFVEVAELRPGDSVLDCTLGLAQDALVAARAVGPQGRVVALEASLPVFAVVSEGLRRFDPGPQACRVEPTLARADAFLRRQPDRAFDVVFFDPMFDAPRKAQPAFDLLRRYGDPSPLTPELLAEAQRVARRWVVIKASRHSPALRTLGLRAAPTSRYAEVVFARLPSRGG